MNWKKGSYSPFFCMTCRYRSKTFPDGYLINGAQDDVSVSSQQCLIARAGEHSHLQPRASPPGHQQIGHGIADHNHTSGFHS